MVFIEVCLGPVRLVRSSRTRSSGQNWTPSTIQTIQTPSRPGSRRTISAGRKLAGEDTPLPRPLRAQTLFHSTTLRADVHFLPELSEPPNAQTAPIIIPPSAEGGGGASSRPSLSHWQVLARKSLVVSLTGPFWCANRSSSLPLAKTGGKLLDWPRIVVTSRGALSSCRGI